MSKYILDYVRNQTRGVLKDLTVPQQKAVTEVIRGLFITRRPILRHLAQAQSKGFKRQGDKYGYHLSRVRLEKKVENMEIKKAKSSVRQDTIIAYDLTDIAKEHAKKMEGMSGIFDGSKRKPSQGYTIHGIGVNHNLLSLRIHDAPRKTLNQTRREPVETISTAFGQRGIWVFDRGNDHKDFFVFLRQEYERQFIARLKGNRLVVILKTGVQSRVDELVLGQHVVYLMNKYNTKVNTHLKYTITVSRHHDNRQPIRLLSFTKKAFSAE